MLAEAVGERRWRMFLELMTNKRQQRWDRGVDGMRESAKKRDTCVGKKHDIMRA